jgi:hypothetical protein
MLVVLSPVADKSMDDDLAIVEGTHCSSSCAASTNSVENTLSNSSRNSSFFVLLCSPSNRRTEYRYKQIEMLMKRRSDRCVIFNKNKEHKSKCWYLLDFPASIESVGDQPKIIKKFVTCCRFLTTYSFNFNSARLVNNHSYKTTTRTRAVSLSVSSNSSPTYHPLIFTLYVTSSVTKMNDAQIK